MPTKNRGNEARAAIAGAGDGCFGRVLHADIAKAKAPPLKASSLSARAQKNLLRGFPTTAGTSIVNTKISSVIPTRAAASLAWTRTTILGAAQRKARPTR